MKHQEQLTKLIDRAKENGWTLQGHPEAICDTINTALFLDEGGYQWRLNLPTILFGDNLSFLKALVGERHTWEKYGEWPLQHDLCAHCKEDREHGDVLTDCHEVIAKQLVEISDNDRIPWLYEQVISNR